MLRDTRIDSIKFFLMICVIIGHMLYCDLNGKWNYKLFEFIYSFHMPAFVLLSGYCFKKKPGMGGVKDIANLLAVYIIFQILYCGQLVGLGNMPSAFTKSGLYQSVRYFYRPSSVLWYVVALAIWRIFMYFIHERWMNWRILIIAIIVSLLAGLVPIGSEFSFQRTFAFFPFFLLGYILKRNSYFDWIRKINHLFCAVIVVLYICVFLFGPEIQRCLFTQRCYYHQEGMTIYYRLFFYCMALPITISILNLVPDVKFFAQEGRRTMSY